MSNLLKRHTVISKDERVIDYNEIIRNKIEALKKSAMHTRVDPDGFISGLNAKVVEELTDADYESRILDSEAEDAAYPEKNVYSEAAAHAKEIIDQAEEEASKIVDAAIDKAEQIRDTAYLEGKEQAIAEVERQLDQQLASQKDEYEKMKAKLLQEYEIMKKNLEPELIESLTEVFKKVTNTVAEDKQDMILDLINGVMKNSESSKEFTIKVSPEDYKFLINNQGKIYCAMSKDVQIDIIEELSMTKNQCLIECDTGIYNCSLDVQLENLIKDIKLLSCI